MPRKTAEKREESGNRYEDRVQIRAPRVRPATHDLIERVGRENNRRISGQASFVLDRWAEKVAAGADPFA